MTNRQYYHCPQEHGDFPREELRRLQKSGFMDWSLTQLFHAWTAYCEYSAYCEYYGAAVEPIEEHAAEFTAWLDQSSPHRHPAAESRNM